jgi:hypothetical protein
MMKKILLAAMSAVLMTCSGIAWTQENAAAGPRWLPVETFTCNFKDGKTMADLIAVNKEWNKWMDAQGADDYFAAMVTPQYFGERLFDVGWLGAWQDGNAMGAGTDLWLTKGGAIGAKYDAILDCASHTNFVSTMIKPPASEDEEGDDTFVLGFTNCSINEGQEFDAVMTAIQAWAEHQSANGFQNSTYMMFPVYGESNGDYAFKIVEGHDDYTALGADYERMGNGGHWMKQEELFSGLLKCDISRVYDARVVRDFANVDE